MDVFTQQALENADIAANAPPTEFKIGDRVICSGDYRGKIGTIVRKERNAFGLTLLIVKIDNSEDDDYEPCQYPHELTAV